MPKGRSNPEATTVKKDGGRLVTEIWKSWHLEGDLLRKKERRTVRFYDGTNSTPIEDSTTEGGLYRYYEKTDPVEKAEWMWVYRSSPPPPKNAIELSIDLTIGILVSE